MIGSAKTANVKRRGFLGLMAASPFAAKTAAKDILEQEAMNLSGLHVGGLAGNSRNPDLQNSNGYPDHDTLKSLVAEFLKINGIPQFKIDEFKEDAKHLNQISPDLSVLRSMSLMTKLSTSRRKYVELQKQGLLDSYLSKGSGAKKAFMKKFNGWWL